MICEPLDRSAVRRAASHRNVRQNSVQSTRRVCLYAPQHGAKPVCRRTMDGQSKSARSTVIHIYAQSVCKLYLEICWPTILVLHILCEHVYLENGNKEREKNMTEVQFARILHTMNIYHRPKLNCLQWRKQNFFQINSSVSSQLKSALSVGLRVKFCTKCGQ